MEKPNTMKTPTKYKGPNGTVPQQVALAFEQRTIRKMNCNWIFEVNYAINSKHPRLFVYSIKDKDLYSFKCAHGVGGKNESPHDGVTREVSNRDGSYRSSLGVIFTLEPYDSDVVGQALRLNGLSPTNSNILKRGVVLHGGEYVNDADDSSDKSIAGRSKGCLVVDDRYINRKRGGKLIDWLKNGSIGVAHHNGNFSIQP